MKKAIIVDLDGTLCNNEKRQHFMERTPKDWKGFYDGIRNDSVNEWCKNIINHYYSPQECSIILLSGRPDNYGAVTVGWLINNLIQYTYLFMRKEGDFREDYVVKQELYDNEIKDKFDVLFCVDDRKQVVDMWRRNGLTCLQCAEGNF